MKGYILILLIAYPRFLSVLMLSSRSRDQRQGSRASQQIVLFGSVRYNLRNFEEDIASKRVGSAQPRWVWIS